ncbi:MAG: L,D-transpeptidase family protein [Nocardioides sp.]
MKTLLLRVLGLTVVLALLGYLGSAAISGHQAAARSDAPVPVTATPSPTPSATRVEPSSAPAAARAHRLGDTGIKVRELQARLFQLAWGPELTTGRYDRATQDAVRGFQSKRGLEPTGVADQRTWARLRDLTGAPTHDQLFNILQPGPALWGPGATGDDVRRLQVRLIQIGWLSGDVSGTYDAATTQAVTGFQAKRKIPATGTVDQRTLDRLLAMTNEPTYEQMHNVRPKPGGLDPRCHTGRVLCIDKSTKSMRWVVDGQVIASYDVRFGSAELPTREGAFSVFMKSRDHVSTLYHTPMPMAMFFSGGQAVHYSPDFVANGYAGASHGCVNVRDYNGIVALFEQVRIGDKVIIYWS